MASAQPPTAGRYSGLAIASLILSCLAFVMTGPFTSVPGVVCGHLARREIRRDPGVKGDELALVGLILGYLNLALYAVIFFIVLAALILMIVFAAVAADVQATPQSPAPDAAATFPVVADLSAGPPMAMGTWMRVVRSAARPCMMAALRRSGSSARMPTAPQASAIWA